MNLQKKELSRAIWKTVFGDDEDFLSLYFEKVYTDSETLVSLDFSKPEAISHVGFPSFLFSGEGGVVRAHYISGAATCQAHRGEGLMQRLLQAAHCRMAVTGGIFAFLIPQEKSLYQYYEQKAGYFPVAAARTLFVSDPSFVSPSPQLYLDDLSWRRLHLHKPFIYHTYKQWRVAYENARIYGGGAIFDPENHGLLFLEKVSEKPHQWATIVPSDTTASSVGVLTESYDYGMMRLVNIPAVLSIYARLNPHLNWRFALLDNDIFRNSGYYYLSAGQVFFSPFRQIPSTRAISLLTPASLGRKIFQGHTLFFDRLLSPIPLEHSLRQR